MEQLNKIRSELQDIDNKIAYMLDKVSSIQTGGDSNNVSIDEISNKLISLQTRVGNLEINVTNFYKSMEDLQTEFTTLQTNDTIQDSNIIALQGIVSDIQNSLDFISADVSTNTRNLASLSESVTNLETAVNNIETQIEEINQILQSGGNSSSEDLTELSNKVASMETIVNNFTTLIKDRNAALDTTYTQIDPETVVQTYDFLEKRFSYQGTGTYNSGLFEFCVQEGTTACTLKLIVNVAQTTESSTNGTANLCLYLNSSTPTQTESFEYNQNSNNITFTFDLPLTTAGNYFYFTINTTNSTELAFSYAKAEVLNCTNPLFLNKQCPFSVDYFNGKYYLTDCTGEYAKIAEINASDIATINDIQWTTTEYKAQRAVTVGKLNKNVTPYVVDTIARFYLLKDCSILCDSDLFEQPKSVSSTNFAYLTNNTLNDQIRVQAISNYTTGARLYNLYINSSNSISTSHYSTGNTLAFYCGIKTKLDTFSRNEDGMIRIVQNIDGTVQIQYGSNKLIFESGILLHAYSSYISNCFHYTIYVNVYGKIVKHIIKYNLSFTLLSSEVVGDYDNYFEGVNNDYFIVKNNKLYYYKENLQTLIE